MIIRLNEDESHGHLLLWCLAIQHQRRNFRSSQHHIKFPMPSVELLNEFLTLIYSQKLKQDF